VTAFRVRGPIRKGASLTSTPQTARAPRPGPRASPLFPDRIQLGDRPRIPRGGKHDANTGEDRLIPAGSIRGKRREREKRAAPIGRDTHAPHFVQKEHIMAAKDPEEA
jgi:hypothetical protein